MSKRNYGVNEIWNSRNSEEFLDSLKKSLSIMSSRGSWTYTEAWVPNSNESELIRCDSWYGNRREFADIQAKALSLKDNSPLVEVWKSKKPLTLQSIGDNFAPLGKQGIKTGLLIPVLTEGKIIAILSFFSQENRDFVKEVEQILPIASGLIGSGVASVRKLGVEFQRSGGVNENQLIDVFNRICETGVFNTNVVYEEVYRFYNELGFPKDYFSRFSAEDLANYIHAYIAAKKVAETLGKPEEITMERIEEKKRFYLCPDDEDSVKVVERKIEKAIKQLPKGSTYSVRVWCSTGSPISGGKKENCFL